MHSICPVFFVKSKGSSNIDVRPALHYIFFVKMLDSFS